MVSFLVERDSPTRTACSKSLREIFYCPSRYLFKSAGHAIAVGGQAQVRREYFEDALSAMKTLSSSIERATREKHGKDWEKE